MTSLGKNSDTVTDTRIVSIKMFAKLLRVLLLVVFSLAAGAATPDRIDPVKQVLDSRCTLCHGCYDAPCQLKLSAHEGLLRGAGKTPVYKPSRLTDEHPTRLFIDAQTPQQWRELGFHSVIDAAPAAAGQPASDILSRLIRLKSKLTVASGQRLPEDFPLDLKRDLVCPAPAEMDAFETRHPLQGMPYGMAALPGQDYDTLLRWSQSGYPDFDKPIVLPAPVRVQTARWEAFLNRREPRQQLVSRYLYEHLFLGHLSVEHQGDNYYFRLIRSATPTGEPASEIATVYPNDASGVKTFYYRLVPLQTSLLDKTHFVYPLNARRLQRIDELFFTGPWQVGRLPTFSDAEASNPFNVFQAIPVRARYQFLLDDAHYFIENFIKGPVCRGQVALNVINDRFVQAIGEKRVAEGFIECIASCGALLSQHVPATETIDELPNHLWIVE